METSPCMTIEDFLLQTVVDVLYVVRQDGKLNEAMEAELGKGWHNVIIGNLNEHILRSGTVYPKVGFKKRSRQAGGGFIQTAKVTLVTIALVTSLVASMLYIEDRASEYCRHRSLIDKIIRKVPDNSSTFFCLQFNSLILSLKWTAKIADVLHKITKIVVGPKAILAEGVSAFSFVEWKWGIIRRLMSDRKITNVAEKIAEDMGSNLLDMKKVPNEKIQQSIKYTLELHTPDIMTAVDEALNNMVHEKVAQLESSKRRRTTRVGVTRSIKKGVNQT